MEWFVYIENEKNQRIKVNFLPEKEQLMFTGQYRRNAVWFDFSTTSIPIDLQLTHINTALHIVYTTMKSRIKQYENIAKGFTVIRTIEVKDDEED